MLSSRAYGGVGVFDDKLIPNLLFDNPSTLTSKTISNLSRKPVILSNLDISFAAHSGSWVVIDESTNHTSQKYDSTDVFNKIKDSSSVRLKLRSLQRPSDFMAVENALLRSEDGVLSIGMPLPVLGLSDYITLDSVFRVANYDFRVYTRDGVFKRVPRGFTSVEGTVTSKMISFGSSDYDTLIRVANGFDSLHIV